MRRRVIRDDDLVGVTDLLERAFPRRPRLHWERGFRRLGERPAVEGCPRYGFLLEAGNGPVGAVLTLAHAVQAGSGESPVRCHLSSWCVDPPYRMQAPLLVASALRRPGITYVNISPAPHTWRTIEAQGFSVYAEGLTIVAPVFSPKRAVGRAVFDPSAWQAMPEATLMNDHAGYGCTCLVVEAEDGPRPFVFLPFRARSGSLKLPLMQLIHCRDAADLSRFADVIGRALARRGLLGLVVDGGMALGGMPVLRHIPRGRRYVKGPHPPRIGDLSYSERVMFGA